MRNIIILGAGEIGSYIASVLSKEEHNVLVIDKDEIKLEKISQSLDIATKRGYGSDWQLLDNLLELSPDFFFALTDHDETNLVACNIAKHLGYPKTIARIRDNRFFNETRLDFAHIFEIDHFIGPEMLVAQDIMKYMLSPSSLSTEYFAHGSVMMRTFVIPQKWKKGDKCLNELNLPHEVIVALILREGNHVLFPHGEDCILPGDKVTLIGEVEIMNTIHEFFNISQELPKSIVVVGGSLTAVNLIQLLRKSHIDIRIIEKDYNRCSELVDLLPKVTVIHHDATDVEFLKMEKIGSTDLFVSATNSDETNLMTGILAKDIGVKDVVSILTNEGYAPIVSHHGINHVFSAQISAANRIMSYVYSGRINSLVSFYENRAEIVEIQVSLESKITGIPISQLGPYLPKDFIIVMIQNRGRIIVAHGDRIISPGDTVILATSSQHLHELEEIF